jgi:hypothetical protein
MNKLFSMPLYDADTTATAAPINASGNPVPDPVLPPDPVAVVVVQVPTTETLAQMTKEDLSKLKNDLEAAMSAAETTVEKALADAEAKAKTEIAADVNEVEVMEQSFISKYGIGTAHFIEIILLAIILFKIL